MAWELPPGADLVLETHLLPTGKAESIRARVGLYFADGRPSQQPVVLHLGSKTLDIPAGESAHLIEESLTLPTDLRLLSIYPHAHYLGREMWVYATLPDGRELTLIHIARWDFNWQDQYRFLEPIDLEQGTRIRMVYTYDNSLQNPSNPHSPPRRVVYGPSSDDEMGDVWIQGVTNSVPDLLTVLRFLEGRDHQDLIAGYRKRLSDSPEDGEALFGLGSELVAVGDLEGGIENLEKATNLDIEPEGVHLNLGNAYTAAGRVEEAVRQFDLAIERHPERAEGHFNLANTLAAAGRDEESLLAYERALELRPGFASALLNRGNALARVGRSDEALEHYRRALKARPGYPPAVFNLALDARRRGQPSEALDYVAQGLDAEPWSPRLLVAHGDALFDLSRTQRALESYRLAIEVDPRSPGAYVGLGLGLVRQGDLENARRALEKALDIEPGNVDAALALKELLRSADL